MTPSLTAERSGPMRRRTASQGVPFVLTILSVLTLLVALLAPIPAAHAGQATENTQAAASNNSGELPEERELPDYVRTQAPWNLDELAGRRHLHHTHVDAGHADWDAQAGTFDVKVVDGTTPKNPDELLVRLGPDADTDGREVSRIKVPSGRAFAFLGQAGTIVWNAPEKHYAGWAPVWSGLGTGNNFPATIDTDTVLLELVRVTGPGWISVWNGDAATGTQEFFSTRNPGHTRLKSPAGGHGHFNWSFEKPGRYQFVWRAMGKTKDGQAIVGPERTVEWLVGSDADLGLPEGTWPQARTITTPAEDFADPGAAQPGEGDSGSGSGEQPGDGEDGSGSEQPADGEGAPLGDEPTAPSEGYTCLAPAHYDLAVRNDAEWRGLKGDFSIKLEGIVGGEQVSYSDWEAVIPVPDSAASTLTVNDSNRALAPLGDGSRIWTMPEVQKPQIPWVGFTTDHADFSAMDTDGLRLYVDSFTGPGRMMAYTSDLFKGLTTHIDSRDSGSKYTFREPTHVHLGQVFNRPGLYEIYWRYETRYTDPAWLDGKTASTMSVYYAVGNKRIEELCPGWLAKYDVPAASDGSGDAGSGDSGSGGSDAEPGTGSGDGGSGSEQPGDGSATDPGDGGSTQPGEGGEQPGNGDGSGTEQPSTPEKPGQGTGEGAGGTGDGSVEQPGAGHEDAGNNGGQGGKPTTPGTVIAKPVLVSPAALTCTATTIERPASSAEEAKLRAGLLPAEAGAGGRYNSAATTLTFSVGPGASGNATSGHFDVGPVVSGGTIAARIKDDRRQPASWVTGSSLRFAVGDAAKRTIPAGMSQIGTPGSSAWIIGATQDAHVPWVGMNSQHSGLAAATTGPVTFRLDSVSGPGRVTIFESGTLGSGIGRILLSGTGDSFTLPANTHAHYNWVFSQPGTYTLTLSMSVTPTGARLGALTDLPASSGRVVATAKTDSSGRTIVRDVVGRTQDGKDCEIALPALGETGLSGAVTAAYTTPAGGTGLLSDSAATEEQAASAAQADEATGIRRLPSKSGGGGDANTTAMGELASTGFGAGYGIGWSAIAALIAIAMLTQGAVTFAILALRKRSGSRR